MEDPERKSNSSEIALKRLKDLKLQREEAGADRDAGRPWTGMIGGSLGTSDSVHRWNERIAQLNELITAQEKIVANANAQVGYGQVDSFARFT